MPYNTCASSCATSGLRIPPSCEVNPRSGGIDRFIFVSRAFLCEDVTDLNVWINNIVSCQVFITGRVKGQKPKGTVTSEKLTSCLSEQPTGAEKTFTFLDYNAYEGFEDFDFWNEIYYKQTRYAVMPVGCDGRIYPAADFTIDIDEVIPEDSKQASHYDGAITINYPAIIKPFYWPELLDILTSGTYSCDYTGDPPGEEFDCDGIQLNNNKFRISYTITDSGYDWNLDPNNIGIGFPQYLSCSGSIWHADQLCNDGFASVTNLDEFMQWALQPGRLWYSVRSGFIGQPMQWIPTTSDEGILTMEFDMQQHLNSEGVNCSGFNNICECYMDSVELPLETDPCGVEVYRFCILGSSVCAMFGQNSPDALNIPSIDVQFVDTQCCCE